MSFRYGKGGNLLDRARPLSPCYLCQHILGTERDLTSTEYLGIVHADCLRAKINHDGKAKPFKDRRALRRFQHEILHLPVQEDDGYDDATEEIPGDDGLQMRLLV